MTCYYDALGGRGEAMHCGPEAGSGSVFVMRSANSESAQTSETGEREEGEWESHLNLSMIPASRSAVTVQV